MVWVIVKMKVKVKVKVKVKLKGKKKGKKMLKTKRMWRREIGRIEYGERARKR
jgi:hypothetical protein